MKHTTKLRKYFILSLLLCNTALFAQFTRQQAIQKVLNEIVVADTGKINVYSDTLLKTNQDSIVLAFDTTLPCPYSYNWVFFVDDYPATNWAHSCRYIFMDTLTGNYQIIGENQYPDCFNDTSDIEYEIVSQIYFPPAVVLAPNPNASSTTVATNDNLYAVLIVTEDAARHLAPGENRFFWDASLVYNMLKQEYGYSDENIYVHYQCGTSPRNGDDLDGDEFLDDHIDYSASKSRILETFDNLSGVRNSDTDIPALGPDDLLFVYVDGHGVERFGNSTIYTKNCAQPGPHEYLFDYDLAHAVEGIECAQMIFLFQICHSGNFTVELTDYDNYDVGCKNRIVHTATSLDKVSTSEQHLTDTRYTEFTFYWASAVRGYYPVLETPWVPADATGDFDFDEKYPIEHPDDYPPDLNEDGFVQMEEAFAYANDMDAWSLNGFYDPVPPMYGREEPMNVNEMSCNNLSSLGGLAGIVDDEELVGPRNYLIGNTLTVIDNSWFDIMDNANVYMSGENAFIDVNSGGELTLYNDVTINGNEIIVDGEIEIGQRATFNNCDLTINGGINIGQYATFNSSDVHLNYYNLITSFDYATFNQSIMRNYGLGLNISNSTFNGNCVAYSYNGNVTVNSTLFNNTWLYLENSGAGQNLNLTATVTNCSFSTVYTMAAIDIHNYGNFYVGANVIDGYYNGIQILNSGYGTSGSQSISDNEFMNCTKAAIHAYYTTAQIEDNYIHDNNYGLRLYNNCNIKLNGDSDAQTYSETQQIINNDSYELYASTGSFPWYMRYNVIIDEDNGGNPDDPLVYYEPPTGGQPVTDVRYNCWTEYNFFDPTEDLYPIGYMVYPTWCPPYGGGQKSSEIVLQDFLDGKEHFENEEYVEADSAFRSIIENHPEEKYAEAAMKELFSLEKYLDDDYSVLQQYYQTNDSIQADSILQKLSVFLANKCDVEMENWQTAIDHYEDIIENPDTPEDSIFAIIDLGHVYFLMDTTAREIAIGRMLQHKPASREAFNAKTNYLLSLLPFKKTEKENNEETDLLRNGQLAQNIPNPFSDKTTVSFSINEQSEVCIRVFSYEGKLVREISFSKPAGLHKAEVELGELPNGIYFYSLFVNGQLSDTKKMVLMK